MIIKAKHNFFIYNFFKFYSLYKIKHAFSRVVTEGEFNDGGKAVVVISNHVGWWDGFWVMYLNLKIFRRKFHFMMLEGQLRKFWFFKYSGGFSVRKGSRSVIETINHAREIIENNGNLLLIFPQGRLESLYKSEFHFEKGIERILSGNEGKIHLIFMACLVDYYNDQKPSLYIYFSEQQTGELNSHALQENYNVFYNECRGKNIERARFA